MNKLGDLDCWYNGKETKLKNINISILDFGFIHCDATYDVMRSRGDKILNFDLHNERFISSCHYFNFEPIKDLQAIAKRLLAVNNIDQAFVWACVWRGQPQSGRPRDIIAPQHSVVYVKPYYGLTTLDSGLRLNIIDEFRRVPSTCYQQTSKNFGWIEFNLAQRKALELGFDAALLLNPKGYITEGPGFGVCFDDGSSIHTPSEDCLDSVTIKVIENLCKKNKIPFIRRNIKQDELGNFKSAYACSTSGGVTPIQCIGDISYKSKTAIQLVDLFNNFIHEPNKI